MSNIPSEAWAETSPAGSDQINAGDNRIRQMKTQIREVIGVDHDFPSSGQATDNGQHLRVTLQEQADLGSGAVGTTILGNQTVSGKGELVYTDEDNNDIQMTTLGTPVAINGCAAKTTPVAADLLLMSDSADTYKSKKITMANLVNFFYPVGSFYANYSVSTNPGTLFGVGTWVAVEEQVLVGYKSGSANFGTPGASVGAATVTLDETMIPSHTHPVALYKDDGGTWPAATRVSKSYSETASGTGATSATGGGGAHSNIQQSLVCYLWRRSA